MPTRTSGKLIELKTELVQSLKEYADFKNRTEGDITKLTNNLLWELLTKEMIARYIEPYVETLWTKNESLFLKDKENDRIYEVTWKNSVLYCNVDKSKDCEHTKYAWMISELGKLADLKKDIMEGRWDNPNTEINVGVEPKSNIESESKVRF